MSPKVDNNRIFTKDYVLVILVVTCCRIIISSQNTTFPLFITDFLGHNKTIAGALLSVTSISAMLMRPFTGFMLDKGYTKLILAISSVLFGLSVALSGIYTAIPFLFFIRFLYGASSSIQVTSGNTAATYLIPESRMREGLAYFGLSSSISQGLGPIVGLALVSLFGFRLQFVAISFLMTFAVFSLPFINLSDNISMFPRRPSNKPVGTNNCKDEKISNSTGIKKLIYRFVDPDSTMIVAILYLVDLGACSINSFLAVHAFEVGISNISLFFTIEAIAVTVVRLTFGKYVTDKNEKTVLAISILTLFLSLISLSFANQLWHFTIIAAVYGASISNIIIVVQTVMVLNAPVNRRGTANSTYFMSYDMGVALTSPVYGAIGDALGSKYIFLFACILPLLAFVLLTVKGYVKKRPENS